ncbi:MAG: DUF4091 domain-containing protein [Anaerolineae bacterium]|nr:DUF4091 domain-containing protein [Anaerolineae bacterium]
MKTKQMLFTLILVCGLLVGGPGPQIAGLAAPSPAGPSAPTAMVVWTEHIAHKVQPTTAAGSGAAIALEGARGSYEAAQIIVRAGGSALSGVNMTAGALSDGAGHTIAASNVTFFRQAFIDFTGVQESEPGSEPVPEHSPTGDPHLPDPLIPFVDPYTTTIHWVGAPFAVAADRNQPVWVDFAIPEDAAAGVYTGAITVTATGEPAVVVPVTLRVWNLTLPDMRAVTTYFSSHFEEVIYYHRDTYDCSSPNDCWIDYGAHSRTIVKRYQELAHAHRIDTGPYFTPDPGNGCSVPTDWSDYDAAVAPYMDGSYWSNGVPSTWIHAPFSPGVDWGLEENCTPAEYTALAQAWAAHLKAQGWFTRTIAYAYDEPPEEAYDDIAADSALMQAGDPDWKAQIMDTISAAPSTDVLTPALGIFCQCLRCYDHWYQDQEEYGRVEWPALFAQGTKLWFYESNAQSDPFPTFAANTLLGVEPRIVMWGSWYEYASGFLLWDTVAWERGDPWGYNDHFGKSGDGVLLYPGHHDGILAPAGSPADVAMDGPVPSYRLKVIRQGLQDWALFKLAESRGYAAYARAEVGRVYGQFGGCDWSGCPEPVNGEFYWLTDPALLDEVRHNIAMKLMGVSNVAPYVPSHPDPADGATGVFTGQWLRWQGGDADGDIVTYTLTLTSSGTVVLPPLVVTTTQAFYDPALALNTTYYWVVTATDGISVTAGPLWQFTTVAEEHRIYLPLVLRH